MYGIIHAQTRLVKSAAVPRPSWRIQHGRCAGDRPPSGRNAMKIEHVHVRVVGPDVMRYHWAEGMPDQYMTATLVSITTDEGIEGIGSTTTYSPYDFDRSCAESI